MNFRAAAKKVEADLTSDTGMDSGWPTDRPTHSQPPPATDGLDPAALGGPSPLNAFGPLGDKVVSDPLIPTSHVVPGQPIPHKVGPDVDQTVLKSNKEKAAHGN